MRATGDFRYDADISGNSPRIHQFEQEQLTMLPAQVDFDWQVAVSILQQARPIPSVWGEFRKPLARSGRQRLKQPA